MIAFEDRRRGFKMMRYLPNKKHLNTVEKKPALWWKSALAFFCDVMGKFTSNRYDDPARRTLVQPVD
ncbi:hypothetical protein PsorP6_004489 [Peronosclerospora sorghi]|uniref:Uncharacterized protein n=1 Tax=Peronosclerospora sorghi TaxID=230839 RepID=A0ACC0VND9_9STRA|nr:hypothetical protein PsorP6_004489 [Peronosclerospora sorghi]